MLNLEFNVKAFLIVRDDEPRSRTLPADHSALKESTS